MCGIFAYLSYTNIDFIKKNFKNLQPRGPDKSIIRYLNNYGYIFGFHRLAINDLSPNGDQPIIHPNFYGCELICNGEIYNYKELVAKYGFNLKSNSDCEVIIHLYKKFGIEKTICMLDGVFAFVLYDNGKQFAGRDPYGVRPLFIGKLNDGIIFASEMKGLIGLANVIEEFPSGCFFKEGIITRYYYYIYPNIENDCERACEKIRYYLIDAVRKRLLSDRPIGCLLSGGLDSSLITALVAKYYPVGELETFSIGMKNSTDLYYARLVANHLQTKHHNIELCESDFLNAIETVIKCIESYDTTTVRASVGNYLVASYIRKHSDAVVIFNGDGSDEVCGSYLYLKNAPTNEDFHAECVRLLEEIHCFDVLRSDRTISGNGLEPRTPFLDKAFVECYMSIDPNLRTSKNRIEKWLLRKSFEDMLPEKVLWRQKEAFSDGVSGTETSWYKVIQEMVEEKISDKEFEQYRSSCTYNPPQLKETMYYRKIFEKYYPNEEHIIPHYWLPRWSDSNDPSARTLDVYKKNELE